MKSELDVFVGKLCTLMYILIILIVFTLVGIWYEHHAVEWEAISPNHDHPPGYWVTPMQK